MKRLVVFLLSALFTMTAFANDFAGYTASDEMLMTGISEDDSTEVTDQDIRCVMRLEELDDQYMMFRNDFGPREREVICDNYEKGFRSCVGKMIQKHGEFNKITRLKNTEWCTYYVIGYNESKFQWRAVHENPNRHLAAFYRSFTNEYNSPLGNRDRVNDVLFHLMAEDQNMDDSIFDNYPANRISRFDILHRGSFEHTVFRADATEAGYNEYRRFLSKNHNGVKPLPKQMFTRQMTRKYDDNGNEIGY